MAKVGYSRQLRVGLQLKSVLILTFIVLAGTVCGGWFYYDTARTSLRDEDQQRAMRIAQALGLAAQHDLHAGKYQTLDRLVNEYLRNDNIQYVAIVDAGGAVVASAAREERFRRFSGLDNVPVSVSITRRAGEDLLVLARPIIMRDVTWWKDRLAGSVRLVLDTSATTADLAEVQQRMGIIAGAVIAGAIPLGYLLVWRVLVQPVRKLVGVTRRLGDGDFRARAELVRGDEIGELGGAFNGMAGQVESMRNELVRANEQLEQKVAERTEELQVANRRLRQEMAEKEDFLRAVSHDLNAPLRNIAGMATMLMMKWRDQLPDQAIARLERIQANVDVETSLITELLELSRIRSRPQRRKWVDMGRLIQDVGRTFEYELKSREITLEVASPMPRLHVEASRMRQLFQNLIDNAIKYMGRPSGGRIAVGYQRVDGEHRFSVADNGPGIAADQQEKIFYVFRRAPGPGGGNVQGKGVGLALVKTVASNYEGRAWVESEPQRGSTFYVSLAAACTEGPEPAGPEPAAGDDSSDQQHCLAGVADAFRGEGNQNGADSDGQDRLS